VPANSELDAAFVRKARFRADVSEFGDRLRFAEIRCLSVPALLERGRRVWEDPDRELIIRRVQELAGDHELQGALPGLLEELELRATELTGKARGATHRSIARMMDALPSDAAREKALADLDHPWKYRRTRAYKVLRDKRVGPELARRLMERHSTSGDQETLQLIARDPAAVGAVDYRYLVAQIEDEYWRMRAVEALLQLGEPSPEALANEYPWEFSFAVGRLENKGNVHVVARIAERSESDPRLLAMCAWCLGRLGATREVAGLRVLLERLREGLAAAARNGA
jgi:hypothetical protein